MSIQQVLRKLGRWSVALRPDAPPGLVSQLEYFGHVAVIPGRVNPVERGEECLTLARYVGVLRTVDADAALTLSGSGMETWLGDEDGKGPVFTAPGVTLSGETFAASIRALLPPNGDITEGTLTAVAGTYDGLHIYQTSRTAIDYVCDLFDADWRVNGDGTLDAGPASALFATTPTAIVARRDVAGVDMGTRALPGDLATSRSAQDYTTDVVVVAEGLATGSASAPSTPYKNIHGGDVSITRVVDEQDDTSSSNAAARAQMVLNLWNGTRKSVRLSVSEFDIAGDFTAGDVVWVWDPDAGLVDTDYEVPFRGRLLNPVPVRVLSVTWPVTQGYTVAYRGIDGDWTDLTEWVAWESASGGEVEVADTLSAALSAGIGSIGTQVSGGGGGAGDPSVPDVPTFGTFSTTSYQPSDGLARASVKVTWTQPLNTDSSTIVDGDHYEVRYRPTATTDWQVAYAGWDQASLTVTDLPPSTGYDWQIRAVDYASPINYGAWSPTTAYSTAADTTPPDPPAAATVAASLIAVQVTHTLGLAAGGTYNLPLDMDHLKIHVGTSSGFTPDSANLVGKLPVNAGMITGGIPAVGTYPVDTHVGAGAVAYVKVVAVDRTGNESTASAAACATAVLIDSAHISDLTASKITAGTMTAAVILGGSIKTATSGARTEMDANGIRLYNSGGTKTVDLSTITGDATVTGTLSTATSGNRVEITATGGVGTVYFRPASGSDFAYLNSPASGSVAVNSGDAGGGFFSRLWTLPTGVDLGYLTTAQATAGGRLFLDNAGARLTASAGDRLLLEVPSGGYLEVNTSAIMQSAAGSYVYAAGANATVYASAGTAQLYSASGIALVYGSAGVDITTGGTARLDLTSVNTATVWSTAYKNQAAYTATTSSFGANMYVHTTWQVYRAVSTARAKSEIEPAAISLEQILALEPATFYDRREWDEAGEDPSKCERRLGLIAEQAASVPGVGPLLTQVGEEGDPEAVDYSKVGVVCLSGLRELAERVAALEGSAPPPRRPGFTREVLALSKAARPEDRPGRRRPAPDARPAPPTPDTPRQVPDGPRARPVR